MSLADIGLHKQLIILNSNLINYHYYEKNYFAFIVL